MDGQENGSTETERLSPDLRTFQRKAKIWVDKATFENLQVQNRALTEDLSVKTEELADLSCKFSLCQDELKQKEEELLSTAMQLKRKEEELEQLKDEISILKLKLNESHAMDANSKPNQLPRISCKFPSRNPSTITTKPTEITGFTTAGGSAIAVSKENLALAAGIFSAIDPELSNSSPTSENNDIDSSKDHFDEPFDDQSTKPAAVALKPQNVIPERPKSKSFKPPRRMPSQKRGRTEAADSSDSCVSKSPKLSEKPCVSRSPSVSTTADNSFGYSAIESKEIDECTSILMEDVMNDEEMTGSWT